MGGPAMVPHRPRPEHKPKVPVWTTMRARDGLPAFDEPSVLDVIREAIHESVDSPAVGGDFRVTHFKVERDRVELLVEAIDADVLSRGMQGVAVRVARAFQGVLGLRGQVFAERFRARELGTAREVQDALQTFEKLSRK